MEFHPSLCLKLENSEAVKICASWEGGATTESSSHEFQGWMDQVKAWGICCIVSHSSDSCRFQLPSFRTDNCLTFHLPLMGIKLRLQSNVWEGRDFLKVRCLVIMLYYTLNALTIGYNITLGHNTCNIEFSVII